MPPTQAAPSPTFDWPIPKLRLQVADLSSAGSRIFFAEVDASKALPDAVLSVMKTLYTPRTVPRHVRSVTLYLDDMDGVAYTKGSDLDDDHKEIHFSTNHIFNSRARARSEILGVIVHEMVHCFQYNGKGQCPGGLIEGIADYVRLRADLAPPHWRKGGEKWDEGYQTTGYFLAWIEETYGAGSIYKINASMRDQEYNEKIFVDVTGKSVQELWELYKKGLKTENQDVPATVATGLPR